MNLFFLNRVCVEWSANIGRVTESMRFLRTGLSAQDLVNSQSHCLPIEVMLFSRPLS